MDWKSMMMTPGYVDPTLAASSGTMQTAPAPSAAPAFRNPFSSLLGGPDLSMYAGLLSPEALKAMQSEGEKRKRQAFGAALLQAAAPSPVRNNFAAGLGQALGAAQQAGDAYVGQQVPLNFQLEQMRQAKAKQDADAARQEQVRQMVSVGDFAGAAAIDPQFTKQFRDATAAERPPTLQNVGPGGFLVDPTTGKPVFQAPFKPETPAAPTAPSGFRIRADGGLEPIPGGPADPAAPKPASALTPDAALKVAQLQSARNAADQYRALVVNKDGSFNDLKARMPEARRLLTNAVRAKLRAESGATITDDEVNAELDRYGAQLTSTDSVNSAAVDRLMSDLDALINSVNPSSRSTGPQISVAPSNQPVLDDLAAKMPGAAVKPVSLAAGMSDDELRKSLGL